MLDRIFLRILNMSFTASFVILIVLVTRAIFRKSPKLISYSLWGVVLFRLIIPFSFESIISILPIKSSPISQDIIYMAEPKIDTGITVINNTVNASLPAATPIVSINPLQIWIFLGRTVWLAGIAVLLAYSIFSLLRLYKKLKIAVHDNNNIYIVKGLETAFIMGFIRPKIYLPEGLSIDERKFIVLHEETHIKRYDHITKLLFFSALCLHWFNPLVWLAFSLSNRDMEMSCDEAVIKKLGDGIKKEYSSSLLNLAVGRRIVNGTLLAFGEGDTKDRIKNVLNYKRPKFWIVAVSLAAVIYLSIGLLANPRIEDFNIADINAVILEIDRGNQTMTVRGTEKNSTIGDMCILTWDKDPFITLATNSKPMRLSIDDFSVGDNIKIAIGDIQETYPTKAKATIIQLKPKEAYTYSLENLWKARTKYVGDNSAVAKIIGSIQFPEGVFYDSFELHTSDHPYGITINFKTDTETRNLYSGADNETPFRFNSMIMFLLIENVELITFSLDDGVYEPSSLQYTSGMAEAIFGEDYFKVGETFDGFRHQINRLKELSVENNTISIQYSGAKIREGIGVTELSPMDEQLAEAIIMDYMLKSSVWKGVDINALKECYLIRQTFTDANETHDFYAYILNDGKTVLQTGLDGFYSVISPDLYARLVVSFD